MAMTTINAERLPMGDTDYATPPGEILRELLDEQGSTQRDLARRADLSPKHVNQLIHGLVPLTADVAQRLEFVTGVPARMWNRLEADYRSDIERLNAQRDLEQYGLWLSTLPVNELVKRGILPPTPKDKASRIEQMLSFFGVASIDAWTEVYERLACSFRQSQAFEPKPGAVAAWLRLGESAAHDIHCEPFDRGGLIAALPALRALTREAPEEFEPKMQTICARNGVAVVFVKEIPGARASGVSRWLTPQKALIQLSLRYKTDDQLWFTFFHELAHVILHGKTDVWIEDGTVKDDPKETQADAYSRDLLIPPAYSAELKRLRSLVSVEEFAKKIGTSPGIVVGRLQHDGIWPPSNGNRLKRRFELAE
jgi:HTH-type transcriptional regulator / antitoxin HigA